MRYPNTKHQAVYHPNNYGAEYNLMKIKDSHYGEMFTLEQARDNENDTVQHFDALYETIERSKLPTFIKTERPINRDVYYSRRLVNDRYITVGSIIKFSIDECDPRPHSRADMICLSLSRPIGKKYNLWANSVYGLNMAECNRVFEEEDL